MNNPVAAATMLGILIGIPFVFVIVCYASAGCLRIAAKWLNFDTIQPGTAFKTACTAMFIVTMTNLSVSLQYSSILFSRINNRGGFGNELMFFSFSPNFYAVTLGASLGLTSLIFCRMLYRGESEKPLSFQDALTLSALHYAILSGSIILLVGSTVLFVYAVVSFMPFP